MVSGNQSSLDRSIECIIELLFGELTINEFNEIDEILTFLDDETFRKAIIIRTHNACERLLGESSLKVV